MTDKLFLLKLVKFCIVGASGMVIDFGTTWLLKEKARINKYLANSAGFILSATSNYVLNRCWTFHSLNPEIMQEYTTFILIAVTGLGLNNLIIYLMHGRMKLNFYLAKLFAIGVVTLWNFSMNYLITFR